MKTILTAAAHRAAAERLLSAASNQNSERDFMPHGMTPEIASLVVARAQVHATLAGVGGEAEAIELSKLMDVLAEGVRFGLTNEDRKIRNFAESLRDSLADAGFDLEPLMRGQSSWDGRGPHHAKTAGVVIPLGHQYVDRSGVVWEETGEWVYDRAPVMVSCDEHRATRLRLNALLCTRGPLRSAKTGIVYEPAEDEDGFNPFGYPGLFDVLAKTWTDASRATSEGTCVWDLTRSYVDSHGAVWTWEGGFDRDSGEPEFAGPHGTHPISTATAFGETLRPLETAAAS